MIEEVVKCDFCGVAKGDSNHWFIGFIGSTNIFNLFLWPKPEDQTDIRGFKHICGQQCAQKFLESWMSK
jgi:hypothetical protein